MASLDVVRPDEEEGVEAASGRQRWARARGESLSAVLLARAGAGAEIGSATAKQSCFGIPKQSTEKRRRVNRTEAARAIGRPITLLRAFCQGDDERPS